VQEGETGPDLGLRSIDGTSTTVGLSRFDPAALSGAAPWPRASGRGGRGLGGWFWSSTMSAHVPYATQRGLARLLLADHDRSVVGLHARPLRVQLHGDGGTVEHVPDLVLARRDATVTVVDVASPSSGRRPANPEAGTDWAAVFAARGWVYEVFTAADATMLANLRFAAGFRRPLGIDPSLCEEIVTAARALGAARGSSAGLRCGGWRPPSVSLSSGAGARARAASAVVRAPGPRLDGPAAGLVDGVGIRMSATGGSDTGPGRGRAVGIGTTLVWDGEHVEVVEFSGTTALLRDGRGRYRSITITELLTAATAGTGRDEPTGEVDGFYDELLAVDDDGEAAGRAAQVREMLTGYRSGSPDLPGEGEPRAQYEAALAKSVRYAAKAAELGVSVATVRGGRPGISPPGRPVWSTPVPPAPARCWAGSTRGGSTRAGR